MHEAGLMQTALDMAFDEARRVGAVKVRRLVLRIGSDAGIMPDALHFAFEALSKGTLADGASLEMEVNAGAILELARVEVVAP